MGEANKKGPLETTGSEWLTHVEYILDWVRVIGDVRGLWRDYVKVRGFWQLRCVIERFVSGFRSIGQFGRWTFCGLVAID